MLVNPTNGTFENQRLQVMGKCAHQEESEEYLKKKTKLKKLKQELKEKEEQIF